MTNLLKEAIAKVETLPEAAQQQIGEELLLHVERLHRLRTKLEKGISSLNRGEGRELDIREIIKRARARYGRS